MVLQGEDDLGLVPERLAHLRVSTAVAVESGGQQFDLAAARVDDRDLRMSRVVEHPRVTQHGKPGAVRRPRDTVDAATAASEPPGLPTLGGHEVHVADGLDVPVWSTRRDKGKCGAVRRPRGSRVLVVPVSELDGLAGAVRADREQVLPAVGGPADVVVLVLQASEAPRPAAFVVLFVVGGVGHPRDEGDGRAVRRPGKLGHIFLEIRELARLAPGQRHHVELHGLALAVRGEGELRTVRRPARVGVVPGAGGEGARLRRAVRRRQPDRPAVVVGLGIDRRDHVGHRRAVRRKPGISHALQGEDILRHHPVHPLPPRSSCGSRPPAAGRSAAATMSLSPGRAASPTRAR